MKAPKRIIFNVGDSLHQRVKIAATKRNISITRFVLQAVVWRLRNDEGSGESDHFRDGTKMVD